jgi:hypothetical protein
MTNSILKAIDRAKLDFPSIYSKDDVIKMLYELSVEIDMEIQVLQELEATRVPKLTDEQIDSFAEGIANEICRQGDGLVRDYSLSMDQSRTIDIDEIEFDLSELEDLIKKNIREQIQ